MINRSFGRLERALATTMRAGAFNISSVARFPAQYSPSDLMAASDRVVSANLNLRCTMNEGFSHWTTSVASPEVVFATDDEDTLLRAGLVQRFEAGEPLLRIAVPRVPRGEPPVIAITACHLLMDGTALLRLYHDIAQVLADDKPQPFSAPLLQDERLNEGLVGSTVRALLDGVGQEMRYRSQRHHRPLAHSSKAAGIASLSIPVATVNALALQARRRRLTLHATLQAVQSAAVARLLDTDGMVRGIGFANLRSRYTPPAADHELGAGLAMMPFTVPPNADQWQLADEIQKQLVCAGRRRLHRGRNWLAPLLVGQLARSGERMGDSALSWSGRLPDADGQAAVSGIRAFVSPTPMGPVFGSWAYRDDGGVHIHGAYPLSTLPEAGARDLVNHMRSDIVKLAESA